MNKKFEFIYLFLAVAFISWKKTRSQFFFAGVVLLMIIVFKMVEKNGKSRCKNR